MELTLNKNELAGALPALGKLVSRTSLTKMCQAIQIEGKANALSFCTRNDTEEIEFRLPADLENGFPAALVEFEQFRLAVRNSKKKTIVLGFDKGDVFIEGIKLNPIAGRFPEPDVIPDRDACVTELPADTLSAMSLLALLTDKGVDVRKVLGGINISRDGFTATNGKELSNIPLLLETTGSVTIPFPLALLATKAFGESGRLSTWQKEEDTHFELILGSWTWRAKAFKENYPNWKRVVPERSEKTHYVSFQPDRAERLMRYLKSIPDDREHNNAVKLCRLPEVPDNLHLESSNGMLFSILAAFDDNWGDLSVTIRKEFLAHLLNAGHTRIELNDAYGPIVGTGGTGQFIAMPIRPMKSQTASEQKQEETASETTEQTTNNNTNNNNPKEKSTMIDTNTITHVVSAPAQAFTPNNEPVKELNPLDELTANIEAMKAKLKAMYDESAVMSRKVREVAIAQRQKEREYVQTKRTIERIRTASGF
jgi:hypothetical protein